MNPIYRFTLSVGGGTASPAFPVYGDDLAKEYELASGEMFYRAHLSGRLRFCGADYAAIAGAAFDAEFRVVVEISYNGGISWAEYWTGKFYKTDCTFDDDAREVSVTPSVADAYDAVLAGMEKEFNLIDLAPACTSVRLDKRPMIQVYVPGQTTIGCFLSGMWWEQECEAVLESDTIQVGTQVLNKLTDYMHFVKCTSQRSVEVESGDVPVRGFTGAAPANAQTPWSYETDGYTFRERIVQASGSVAYYFEIVSGGTTLWQVAIANPMTPPTAPLYLTLLPMPGTSASGNVSVYIHDIPVYSRWYMDVTTFQGNATYDLPEDDITPDNRNYRRCYPVDMSDYLYFSAALSATPTKWGTYQPGAYYDVPDTQRVYFPVARNAWGLVSVWISPFSNALILAEADGRMQYTLRDAFPVWSVIAVLLGKIAPGVSHAGTPDYSAFLYDENPLTGITQALFMVPKSNLVNSGYDQPAQKAPVTLRQVLDMLRDCFRCYWFIDGGKLRIEHVRFFRGGGSYSGTPSVGTDLTRESVSRSGKRWSFATNKYQFDRPDMAARYQFGWMDDVTELFEGHPIDIVSKYVNPDKIEEVAVAQFTSDVDYILLNPGAVSPDGFALLGASWYASGGYYVLPYYDNVPYVGAHDYLQNGYLSFLFLQTYYLWDLPAKNYAIDGVAGVAHGVKRLKRQEVDFPAQEDPDTLKLVKTGIGNGEIRKISINLSSRNAKTTLVYDTE